jgi:hypothetical protein
MLERGSERIEREMCCKCSKCVKEREREGEWRCVVICKVLLVQTEREMCCKCLNYVRERGRGIERRGVVLKCLECRETEMCCKC